MHPPCIPHASNRRGITHQAIDGVERPFLPRWSQKPHGEAFPTRVFSFETNGFSRGSSQVFTEGFKPEFNVLFVISLPARGFPLLPLAMQAKGEASIRRCNSAL